MLVSINSPSSLYIGLTQDMTKRLKQHNSGVGARASSDPSKRPWGLLAYITGFNYNRSLMRQFEIRWQNIVAHLKPSSATTAATLASRIIDNDYADCELQLFMMSDSSAND